MANNLIQIKRSLATAQPGSLANGELAFTSNGDVLFIGANSEVVAIGGKRVPGTLTANQALVANSTSGIDKVITGNLVVTTITANGVASPGAGYLLSVDSGGNTYWLPQSSVSINTAAQFSWSNTHQFTANIASSNTTTGTIVITGGLGVSGKINTGTLAVGNDSVYTAVTGSNISTTDVFATGTVNAAVITVDAGFTANNTQFTVSVPTLLNANVTIGASGGDRVVFQALVNSNINPGSNGAYSLGGSGDYWSAVYAETGYFNETQVGTAFIANSSQVTIGSGIGLSANGTVGSNGYVLISNGTSAYWGEVEPTIVAGDGIDVNATSVSVKANNGIIANSSGTFADGANGISVTADGINAAGANGISVTAAGINVVGGAGLVSNATGVHVGQGNGLTVEADSIRVQQANGIAVDAGGVRVAGGPTLTVNNSGAHVNTDLSITSLTLSGDLTVNGNTQLGNATSDVISFTGRVNTDIVPSSNNTYSLGSSTNRWANVHANDVFASQGTFTGDVSVGGDILVTGNLITQNVSSVIISDPLIYLAGNNYASDVVDIGFVANYSPDGNVALHTGLFRDATDGIYKLFVGSEEELDTVSVVNTAANGWTLATLQTYLQSGGLISNATHIAITANSSLNVAIVANTLSLTTALPVTSGGIGLSSISEDAILVGNTGNTLTALSLGTSGYVLQSNGSAVVYDSLDGGTF